MDELLDRLLSCPSGVNGWKEFEDICIDILIYLFVPPLKDPIIQKSTLSGIDRRDAVFPNRNFGITNIWGLLLIELEARMILFEFKNYDLTDIGKEEVDQTRNYLTAAMGKLAIMVCSKEPAEDAKIRRNVVFNQDNKVILFVTKDHLEEMLYIKKRGEDPADLIMDLLEIFYLQHE